jgi:hypothetical protein
MHIVGRGMAPCTVSSTLDTDKWSVLSATLLPGFRVTITLEWLEVVSKIVLTISEHYRRTRLLRHQFIRHLAYYVRYCRGTKQFVTETHYTPRFHQHSSVTTKKNVQTLSRSCNRVRMNFSFTSSFRTTFSLAAPIFLPVHINFTNIIKDILKMSYFVQNHQLISHFNSQR